MDQVTKNIKCLITAGCSFSQVPNTDITWPVHLSEWLEPEKTYYLGQGAAGNGIISRKVIYTITEALKTYNSNEILVGIMWSGVDRSELYSLRQLDCTHLSTPPEYTNPLSIIDEKNYYIVNAHWTDKLSTDYYRYLHTPENSILNTLEHVLRTQWFLEKHNIKYFMTEYKYNSVNGNVVRSKDILFLLNQINKDYWLPIKNMYEWAVSRSNLPFDREGDDHPSTAQHKKMVKKILIPFLIKNKLLNGG
jgi:hypothetical protein